ncbi:helix-turn-helix domain-containing protein [Desulfosediminicola sp.]|uniref:helix-turn-helix domain-containing protein n=1 Tax=Desulfosediminicola sp. TaxID=2886825 RepID=UPI003AF22165
MSIELNIPHIDFCKKRAQELQIEIFSLAGLFNRRDRLEHPLEKPHRVNFYQILLITKGHGQHHIDFQPYPYQPGTLLMVSKNQVHAFTVQPEVDGLVLLFTDTFLEKNMTHDDVVSLNRLMNYHLRSPLIEPAATEREEIASLIDQMVREYRNPDHFAKEEILRLQLKQLLLKIERIQHRVSTPPQNLEWFTTFELFRTLLEQHFSSTRNVVDYAEMLGKSTKHLGRICKAMTNSTAKEFIDSYTVLEIKRHLATSSEPIQELTYQCGFDEATNFVKFFKKHTGQSPARFRKNFTK